jgi:ankyrin repeat protein
MKTVLYWKECISDLAGLEPYATSIQSLLCGEYAALRLEKLNVQSRYPLYSIRHSYSTRILFTIVQNKICILEVILNHDYHKSRFLRNRYCLAFHLERISESITTSEVTELSVPISVPEHIQYQSVLFHQDFIELNACQEHAIHASFPMVLHGPAGSGKTTVAIELLQKLHQNQTTAIIYLTESSKLRDYVRNIWENLQLDDQTDAILFLTYRDFLMNILGLPSEIIVDKQHFQNWYQQYSYAKYFPLDTLYKEFRVLSGYEFAASHHLTNRDQMNELFNQYQQYLGDKISQELSFIDRGSSETHLIIDEAQDFSFGQMKTLLNYAGKNCAILLGEHQILVDEVSKFPFVKQFYYEKHQTQIKNYPLTENYRCSLAVSELVNVLTRYKYQLTGGSLDKIEMGFLELNLNNLGSTEWMQKSCDTIKERSFHSSWAIINFSTAAQTSFYHPLVFTPAESKGLEFETVILWKPFENNQNILKALRQNTLNKESIASTHRPKAGQENLEYLNDFNTLITAMTRAKSRLIIVDNQNVKKNAFLSKLMDCCTLIEVIDDNSPHHSSQDWPDKLHQLMMQGLESHAKKVFIEKLGRPENEFELFKSNYQTSSSSPVTVSQKLSPVPQGSSVYFSPVASPLERKQNQAPKKAKNVDLQETKVCFFQELDTFFQEKNYRKAIENLFLNANYENFSALLSSRQYQGQSVVSLIESHQGYWQAFIYTIGSNAQVFRRLHRQHDELLKIVSPKSKKLWGLLNFIKTHEELCKEFPAYTFLFIVTLVENYHYLQICLQSGVDVNLECASLTPAHILLNSNRPINLSFFNLFLQYQPDLTQALDGLNNTPFEYLIYHNRLDYIQRVLSIRPKLDVHEHLLKNNYFLMNAYTQNLFEIFKLFIKHGSNPFCDRNENLNGPDSLSELMMYMICNQSLYYFDVIIKDRNLNSVFNEKKTLIFKKVMENKKLQLLDYLLSQVNLDLKPDHLGNTILHYACKYSYPKIINYFADNHANLNVCNNNGETPFLLACQEKSIATLGTLLKHKINVMCVDNHNQSALMMLIQSGSYSIIKKMFEQYHFEPDYLNSVSSAGDSAIHCALKIPDLTEKFLILSILLKQNGINPNLKFQGYTLLHIASQYAYTDIVELLLDKDNIDPNLQTPEGYAPLHIAAQKGHLNVVQALLANKIIQVNIQTSEGSSALHFASRQGHLNIVQALLNHDKLDPNLVIKNTGATPLHLVVQNGDIAVVQALLKKEGVNPNAQIYNGCASLHFAAKHGYFNVIQALLEKEDIKVNIQSHSGFAPLHYAVKHGHLNIVQAFLLQDDIQLNIQTTQGTTPLHLAVQNASLDIVEAFLKKEGIQPNILTSQGFTSLEQAVQTGQKSIVQMFLDKEGVDVNRITLDGFSLLHIAAQAGHANIVQLLLNKNGVEPNLQASDGSSPIYLAAHKGHLHVVQMLLDIDSVDPNLTTNKGFGPIHIAAYEGHENIVQVLLKKAGVHPNTQTFQGFSALHYAAQQGHADMVQVLLDTDGIDINLQTKKGHTALYLAARSNHLEVVEVLLRKDGIQTNLQTIEGFTPLHLAVYGDFKEIVKMLLKHGANPALKFTTDFDRISQSISNRDNHIVVRVESFIQEQIALGKQNIQMSTFELAEMLGDEETLKLIKPVHFSMFANSSLPINESVAPSEFHKNV